MPDAVEHMRFAYPFLFDANDDRFVPDEDMDWAMGVATAFRPSCLPVELQNLAQAHYAAYVLSSRLAAPGVFGTVTNTASQNVAGPIVERQEGNVRTKYANGGFGTASSTTTRQSGGGLPGPAAPYAAWAALAAMCGPVPGIDPANPALSNTRGGIIVRSNPLVVW